MFSVVKQMKVRYPSPCLKAGASRVLSVNIVAVVIGAWWISDFALKTKSTEISERKEKRKNA